MNRRAAIKCSSCVKCQTGLSSDIQFETIQMLLFLPFTTKKGEEKDEESMDLHDLRDGEKGEMVGDSGESETELETH